MKIYTHPLRNDNKKIDRYWKCLYYYVDLVFLNSISKCGNWMIKKREQPCANESNLPLLSSFSI